MRPVRDDFQVAFLRWDSIRMDIRKNKAAFEEEQV